MLPKCCLTWHDIADPASRQLNELVTNYSLHLLHIQDCRESAHRIKVDTDAQYLFIVLKLLDLEQSNKLAVEDLILFVGPGITSVAISVDASACFHADQASWPGSL